MAVFKLIGTYMYVHAVDCGEYLQLHLLLVYLVFRRRNGEEWRVLRGEGSKLNLYCCAAT